MVVILFIFGFWLLTLAFTVRSAARQEPKQRFGEKFESRGDTSLAHPASQITSDALKIEPTTVVKH